MTKLIFMGTPAFSATVLRGLLADDNYEILAVVTQPDRAVGRKSHPNDTCERSSLGIQFTSLSTREAIWKPRIGRADEFRSRWDCDGDFWAIPTNQIIELS